MQYKCGITPVKILLLFEWGKQKVTALAEPRSQKLKAKGFKNILKWF